MGWKELPVTDPISSIYYGDVVHRRLRPKPHRLRYKVFSLLLDLDDLENLTAKSKLLSYNRRTFYSIHDKDHGHGKNIKEWVAAGGIGIHHTDVGKTISELKRLGFK